MMPLRGKLNTVSSIANIGFLLLFPAFFFWHFGMAAGFNPIHSGFFSAVSLMLVTTIFVFYYSLWIKLLISIDFFFVVFIFLLYCALWILFQTTQEPPPGTVTQAMVVFLSWLSLLAIGTFMNIYGKLFQFILILSWVVMSSIVLLYVDDTQFIVRNTFDIKEEVATYQGFSRSIMLTSLVIMAIIKNRNKRILFTLSSIVIIFFAAARSELVSLVAIFVMAEILQLKKGIIKIAPLVVIVAALSFFMLYNLDELNHSRQLNLLRLSEDNSWNLRGVFSSFAWNQILSNPIAGKFGGHYYVPGGWELGAYAHNALSAWINFGFVGFSLYVGLAIWAAFSSLISIYRKENGINRLSFYLNISSIILIATAKPVFWPVIALGWGVLIQKKFNNVRMGFK